MGMRAGRPGSRWAPHILVLLLLARAVHVQSQIGGNADADTDMNEIRVRLFEVLADVVESLITQIEQNLGFCIHDAAMELDRAFNFSGDPTFMLNCVAKDNSATLKFCGPAELKLYSNSLLQNGVVSPNINCNLSSWTPGCEPGWACTVPQDMNQTANLLTVPIRKGNCSPCCEGFFSPRGLTCMLPCPLGAYCPRAQLNTFNGFCYPYSYQLPVGLPNHTCGGAERWADTRSSSEIFCPPGYYCPSNIQKIPCSSGHYCRKGSTVQKSCVYKPSCKGNSSNQNLTLLGFLIVVALSLLLVIIYNFSGQALTYRERKQAKSREKAARHAKETAEHHANWKDVAKKHAIGLQTQLTRTFSRKQSKGVGRFKMEDANREASATQKSSLGPSNYKEPSELSKIMHSIDENPDSEMGLNLEIRENPPKKDMKAKRMHTRSQIFKYAYGEIEKEKAMQQQNHNLTFSGVIAIATENNVRSRPLLEVAFKDLTLTLRGNKKKLLKSVTGKLIPGHIAALMGPSGAGKTTFLNALAGKATGCETTGLVLINGKAEPISAYRKIIGFVPQDDIVHGNLTVEENLWFTARCRLSADLSIADKVLVVERVIESLGLQAVRDSLVGTVEKRGISGGQRKRVNVGLEMVMEPSLLILDEPTSGLDSSSSQLLLRALRREALEGVNICMVVHQPSYALFKTFDDLILLAKGGVSVYLGSVKKVEQYFSELGINVPERVNPPDHFIDILEGIEKPPGVNVKQLPVRWMIHNGYDIPPDMQKLLSEGDESVKSNESDKGEETSSEIAEDQFHANEVEGNAKDTDKVNKDNLEPNVSNARDLSKRKTPGVFRQFKYYLGRVGKQRLRESRLQGIDYIILGLAGVCLGTLAKASDDTFGIIGYTYTVIAVSLLCKIGALRSFQPEILHYERERASGMSSAAYFLARDSIDHFNTVIKPLVYLSMFFFFNNLRSSFGENYIILIALVYCVTGIGYTFAVFFQPGSAQLWSALAPVVLTLIATQKTDSPVAKFMKNLCYTKWALEAFVIANIERYSAVWLITRCAVLQRSGYKIYEWWLCILILFLYGVAFRLIAYFGMLYSKRS